MMYTQIKSTGGSLKLCMSMRYPSTDDRECADGCSNEKSVPCLSHNKEGLQTTKPQARASGLCSFLQARKTPSLTWNMPLEELLTHAHSAAYSPQLKGQHSPHRKYFLLPYICSS